MIRKILNVNSTVQLIQFGIDICETNRIQMLNIHCFLLSGLLIILTVQYWSGLLS